MELDRAANSGQVEGKINPLRCGSATTA